MTSLVSPAQIKLALVVGVLLSAAYLGLTIGTSAPNNISATAPVTSASLGVMAPEEFVSYTDSAAPSPVPGVGTDSAGVSGLEASLRDAMEQAAKAGDAKTIRTLTEAAKSGDQWAKRLLARIGHPIR